jgi:hypothetical protein
LELHTAVPGLANWPYINLLRGRVLVSVCGTLRLFYTLYSICVTIHATDFTELFKIVTIDTGFYLFPVEILLIKCSNSHHVCSEFEEEFSMKILQSILCDNHFRICRGLFFLIL